MNNRIAIYRINQEINELERRQSALNFRGDVHTIPEKLEKLQLQKLALANPDENPETLKTRWHEAQAYRQKWGHNP